MEPLNTVTDIEERKPSAETIAVIRELQTFLKQEARRFNMNLFGRQLTEGSTLRDVDDAYVAEQQPPCGTVCCFAGGLCIMKNDLPPVRKIWNNHMVEFFADETAEKASKILGLESFEASKLFYISNWPNQFAVKLQGTKPGTPEYLAVALERLDYYCENGR